jgi:glycine oxidase
MRSYDCVVVGGGIIGGAIAFELARRGVSVLLLDRQKPGLEASWAAAGMLSPAPDSAEADFLVPLARKSYRLYPEFISAVEKTSDSQVEFRECGTIEVFFAPEAEAERDRVVASLRGHGIAAESVSASGARVKEPMLGPAARAAAWIPEESCVDPRELTRATLGAAQRSGAEIRANSEAISILVEQNRCEGVLVADSAGMPAGKVAVKSGEKILAKNVVIAAGSFSGGLGWMERYAPTTPVRGQMVALRSATGALRCILRSSHGYIVPRADGRAIAGSTLEYVGFEKQVTPAGLGKILNAAVELSPALENASVVETWSGLRPDSPDHLPIIGPTDIEGLFIATGHYRNGILLAPATAKCIAEWIVEGKPSIALENFSPLRFAETARGAQR